MHKPTEFATAGQLISARLPREAPLSMPTQEFWRDHARPGHAPAEAAPTGAGTLALRGLLVLLTVAVSIGFAIGLTEVLSTETTSFFDRTTLFESFFIALSTACFAWIAFGSANALIGAVAVLRRGGYDTLSIPPASTPLEHRTAILFPIYHEDPALVAASIEALSQELSTLGRDKHFDVFVLSDTRTEVDLAREEKIFASLDARLAARTPVYYRHRPANTAKKAGNIHDWVARFGADYETFVIFDADSIMSGTTLVRLAAAMQQHPGAGLIQTAPRLIRGETLFARLQQFANGYYGPLVASGFAAWQGACGNYWGHNAIVRTRAFAMSAGLPTLPGAAPLGGHIQSHDFVEAALLRRSGWGVHLAASLEGSYEGCPPTLVDLAVRDRRWMQGNLQHARILGARGFAPLSRLHMALGIIAYLASALWASVLLLGLWLTYQTQSHIPDYFPDTASLFPTWPSFNPQAALWLLIATLGVVFLPKILGLAIALWDSETRGGRSRRGLAAGWLCEVTMTMLLAPVLMVSQIMAFIAIMTGRDSGWLAQAREARALTFATALRFHWLHVALSLAITAVSAQISWPALAWMSPIILGLALSPVLTWWTARPAGPRAARLLATPHEIENPAVVAAADASVSVWRRRAETELPLAGPVVSAA